MNAIVALSAVELALYRAEAARHELRFMFDRVRGRTPTDAEDDRLSDACDAAQLAETELRFVASAMLGVDVQRLCDAIS